MKTAAAVVVFGAALVASSASAQVLLETPSRVAERPVDVVLPTYVHGENGVFMTATPLETSVFAGRGPNQPLTDVYRGLEVGPAGFLAFPVGPGLLGSDDYVSTETEPFALREFEFVGGVGAAGQTLTVSFFDDDAMPNFVTGFNITLPQAGNFFWTITIDDPAATIVDEAGFVEIEAADGSVGQWFLTDGGVEIGSNSLTVGGANGGAVHNLFRLALPTPGTATVMGMMVLVGARRRR